MEKIYTNLNVNNMINELEKHFKNITNKKYIFDCLRIHYKVYNLITVKEYNFFKNKYLD